MFRRHHAIVLCLVLPVVGVLAGCEDDEKATPQVIFEGRSEAGTGVDCQDTQSEFTVGSFGNQALDTPEASKPVKDGEAWEQGGVGVSCSVTPAGADEFNVAASVSLSGATGGLFRIDGKFKTTGEQQGIHVLFNSRKTGNTYEQLDRQCTVKYDTQFQGVAAGRVWGIVTCPKGENTSAQKSCRIVADFRFENCAQ